jgi:predicted acylesterase/phospholipase RssA
MTSEKKKHLSGNLDQLALSLSGGGVRAVGFHLGTMSMLRRLNLLNNVQILSSVSGGSMLGIGYSLTQSLGRDFQDFFDDFYQFLPDLNILEELLNRMSTRQPPAPSGKRDMITAMANVYDELFFKRFYSDYVEDGGLTFELLMKQPRKGHLQDMIFNATEFKTGTAFRFQVSHKRCLIGNGKIALCQKHAGQIRLADIMAASSCIPVGMEPMFFPDDFRWPDDPLYGKRKKSKTQSTVQEIRNALLRTTNESTFALMDGGVYDNQGITSTLLALNRRKEEFVEPDIQECGFSFGFSGRGEPTGPEDWANWMSGRMVQGSPHKHVGVKPEDLDLLIVSDTPVRKASFFPRILTTDKESQESKDNGNDSAIKSHFKTMISAIFGRVTLGHVSFITWALLFALTLSATGTAVEWFLILRPDWDGFGLVKSMLTIFHVLLPLIFLGLWVTAIALYKYNVKKAMEKLLILLPRPRWKLTPIKYIHKLRIADVIQMGILRAGSTAALTAAIYMDRIRGLGYSTAFSRLDLREKVLANEIFALLDAPQQSNDFIDKLTDEGLWPPPKELLRIVGVAANMPTKLWIDHREGDVLNDLDYLVVCGQATICYNLMKFIWLELRENDSWIDPKMEKVFDQAKDEWERLMEDPLSLLKDRKFRSNVPELKQQAEELANLTA